VDYSHYPDLLLDKRGPVAGFKFFSKSPLQSPRLLFIGISNAACLVFDLSVLFRHWFEMHAHARYVLIAVGAVLLISFLGSIRNLTRLRALYLDLDEETHKAGQGSPMDIALGVAAGGITDCLLCISGLSLLVVLYFAYSFH
jgi:hypothetical protein